MENKLASYLKANGITQAEFAPRIGITQGALSKLCNDGHASLETAVAIERETGGEIPLSAWPKLAAVIAAAQGAK